MPPSASSTVFHAVADPTRRRILDVLSEGELPATQIARRFERQMTQPALSRHLRVLREAGLVRTRRSGRHRIYRAAPGPLLEVFDWVARYRKFWEQKLGALGAVLDDEGAPS